MNLLFLIILLVMVIFDSANNKDFAIHDESAIHVDSVNHVDSA